jgi:phytoene dehydrogenase-like protein
VPPKVIIIGAGVSGLSVGCYLQMNGFDTEIFEMHNLPGGVCTAWKRGIGIGKDLRERPATMFFPLKKETRLEGGALTLKRLVLRLFNFDPTMAPPGKTAATVMIESRNLPYWSKLRRNDPARYREEKKQTGELIVEAIEEKLGSFKPFVEVVDVATPATWHRYTGNWQGSYEGSCRPA